MTSQATVLAPVYPSMRCEELGRLLREAGYDIELVEDQDRPTYRMLSEPRFMIRLLGALEKQPGEYHSISVWSRIAVSPAVLADRAGQLLVTHDILIGGGVTAHHLNHQLHFWRADLSRVLQVVRDSQEKSEGRRLN